MSSLDTLATIQKNGVIAINGLNQTLTAIEADLPCICTNLAALVVQITNLAKDAFPATTSTVIAESTTSLITTGSGRIFSVSIPVHSGSSQIYIYDSATVGGIASTNLIYASLPSNAASFTPYQDVRLIFTNGLVLKTDAGINFCVSYTLN